MSPLLLLLLPNFNLCTSFDSFCELTVGEWEDNEDEEEVLGVFDEDEMEYLCNFLIL